MKQNILKHLLLTFFFMAYTLPAMADPNDPDAGVNEEEQQASIDHWIIILLIAAVLVATYFMYQRKNTARIQLP